MLSERASQDTQAVSLAEAIPAANQCVREAGSDLAQRRLVVEQEHAEDGAALWRFSYLPARTAGRSTRGGDFIVDVNALDATVRRTLRGQ